MDTNECLRAEQCPYGTYADQGELKCLHCAHCCKTCIGPHSTDCLKCNTVDGYYKNSGKRVGECKIIICQRGTYFDNETASCLPCSYECETCNSTYPTRCTKCAWNYFEFPSDKKGLVDCKSCSDFKGFQKGKTGGSSCAEICGDGLHMGVLACDDGNTLDGDGCSSSCEIEPGFECSGGNITSPDKCRPAFPPRISDVAYYGNKTLVLYFSQSVIFNDTKIENLIKFKIEGKLNQNITFSWNYDHSLVKEPLTKLMIYMNFDSSLTGDENLIIMTPFPKKITDVYKNALSVKSLSIRLLRYRYISAAEAAQIAAAGTSSLIAVIPGLVIGLGVSLIL